MSHSRKVRGKLLKLYEQIPSGFECLPECGKCCQDKIVMLNEEWDVLMAYDQKHAVVDKDRNVQVLTSEAEHEKHMVMIVDERGWCPFLDEKGHKCMAFEARPYVCRQYGQHWTLGCQEGVPLKPELEVPEEVYAAYGSMMMPGLTRKPQSAMDFFRRAVEWWRAKMKLRPDAMPTIHNAEMVLAIYAEATGDKP